MVDKIKADWFVYVLECADGRLYTGITTHLEKRFSRHVSGRGAKFTQRNRPLCMLGAMPCASRSEASKLEYTVKALRAAEKRALAAGWPLIKNLPIYKK